MPLKKVVVVFGLKDRPCQPPIRAVRLSLGIAGGRAFLADLLHESPNLFSLGFFDHALSLVRTSGKVRTSVKAKGEQGDKSSLFLISSSLRPFGPIIVAAPCA